MSYTDTKIGLTSDWLNGDDGWDVQNNANLNNIRALLIPEIVDVSNNVASPNAGELYIVGVAGTGDFAGQSNKLAFRRLADWVFSPPAKQTVKYNRATQEYVLWTGAAWVSSKALISGTSETATTGTITLDAQIAKNFFTNGATGNITLEFDAYVMTDPAAVGLEDESILDAAITASTYNSSVTFTEPWDARLNSTESWLANVQDVNQWWKVDMTTNRDIVGMAMQGSGSDFSQDYWVESFDLEYSDDDTIWTPYNAGEVLTGNIDPDSIVSIDLLQFNARYIRFNPLTWDNSICARFEFYEAIPSAAQVVTEITYTFKQDATGSRTLTFPASVLWAGGTAPTVTAAANAEDEFRFSTRDGGTTWRGEVVAQNIS